MQITMLKAVLVMACLSVAACSGSSSSGGGGAGPVNTAGATTPAVLNTDDALLRHAVLVSNVAEVGNFGGNLQVPTAAITTAGPFNCPNGGRATNDGTGRVTFNACQLNANVRLNGIAQITCRDQTPQFNCQDIELDFGVDGNAFNVVDSSQNLSANLQDRFRISNNNNNLTATVNGSIEATNTQTNEIATLVGTNLVVTVDSGRTQVTVTGTYGVGGATNLQNCTTGSVGVMTVTSALTVMDNNGDQDIVGGSVRLSTGADAGQADYMADGSIQITRDGQTARTFTAQEVATVCTTP